MDTPVVDEIVRKLKTLPNNLQRQVLLFVDALKVSSERGRTGNQLLKFAGAIPSDDLAIMQQAIEQGCEQVDPDEMIIIARWKR